MWHVQGIFVVLEKEARLIQPQKLNHSIKAETSIAWMAGVQAASTALTAKLHQSWLLGDGFRYKDLSTAPLQPYKTWPY